jgi:hypothetical protein
MPITAAQHRVTSRLHPDLARELQEGADNREVLDDVKAAVDKSVDLRSLINKLQGNKWLVRDGNNKWTAIRMSM